MLDGKNQHRLSIRFVSSSLQNGSADYQIDFGSTERRAKSKTWFGQRTSRKKISLRICTSVLEIRITSMDL